MAEIRESQQEIAFPLKVKISVAVDGFEPTLMRCMQGTTDAQKNEPANELIYRIEAELDTQLPDNLKERITNVLTSTITTSTIVEGEVLKTDIDPQDLKDKLEHTLQEFDISST